MTADRGWRVALVFAPLGRRAPPLGVQGSARISGRSACTAERSAQQNATDTRSHHDWATHRHGGFLATRRVPSPRTEALGDWQTPTGSPILSPGVLDIVVSQMTKGRDPVETRGLHGFVT